MTPILRRSSTIFLSVGLKFLDLGLDLDLEEVERTFHGKPHESRSETVDDPVVTTSWDSQKHLVTENLLGQHDRSGCLRRGGFQVVGVRFGTPTLRSTVLPAESWWMIIIQLTMLYFTDDRRLRRFRWRWWCCGAVIVDQARRQASCRQRLEVYFT